MIKYHSLMIILFFAIFLSNPAMAQSPIKIDLSEDVIDIHSGFSGTSVTLFGIQEQLGDIVLVVKGPSQTQVLREKGRVFGFWLNTSSRVFKEVPGYYAVASSRDLRTIAEPNVLEDYKIGLDFLTPQPLKIKATDRDQLKRYQDAFIQTQQLNNLFSMRTEKISYVTDELFKLRLWFPSNIPIGDYHIDAYLFKNGVMLGQDHSKITIKRIGINESLKSFSTQNAWLYASLAIMIAMISGWLATVLLRRD